MSELQRIMSEHNMSQEERAQRPETLNRLAAEDLVLVERLTIARQMLPAKDASAVNGQRIKGAVIAAVAAYGLQGQRLPRGYVVLGTGEKTPYYLCIEDSRHKAEDYQVVADARSGWLHELAVFLDGKLTAWRKQHGPPLLVPPAALPAPQREGAP